jgi:hypothetical protein
MDLLSDFTSDTDSDQSGGALAYQLSFNLTIDVDREVRQMGCLLAHPEAEITGLKATNPVKYDGNTGEIAELSDVDLDDTIFPRGSLTLSCPSTKRSQTFTAPNKFCFSVRDFMDAVVLFERENRPHCRWFGGIDLYHTVFEGLEPSVEVPEGFQIIWGV